MNETSIWVVIGAAAALVALGAAVVLVRRKRDDLHRARAEQLRAQAGAQRIRVERRTAAAERVSAQARAARAEAKRLEAEAADIKATAKAHADRRNETLRKADEIDPDVPRQRSRPPEGAEANRQR